MKQCSRKSGNFYRESRGFWRFPNNQERITDNSTSSSAFALFADFRLLTSDFRADNQSPITDNSSNSSAFTLIELLVVITIIVVLMGLLFPVFRGAQDQAKKVQAKNDVMQIVTAVNAYFTDYGTYPLNSNQVGGGGAGFDTVYGDPNGSYSSADLFDILRAISDGNYNQNNQLNSRQVVYFNGPNAKDPNNPRSGFATGTGTVTNSNGYSIKPGSYVDPWGDEYVTFIDADYSGEITQALSWFYSSEYQYPSGTIRVRLGVGACSLGKDGKWGTGGNGQASKTDDIISWE